MAKYYALTWAPERPNTGVAYAPDDSPLAYELSELVKDSSELPFDLTLRTGELQDFLANSLAWPLMSLRMRRMVETNLTGNEGIDWVRVTVRERERSTDYFVPKFQKQLDVLDLRKTKFVSGSDHIIKPCFSLPKIRGYSLFHKPTRFWKITGSLYVNEGLKKQIEAHNLTGVAFERTAVCE